MVSPSKIYVRNIEKVIEVCIFHLLYYFDQLPILDLAFLYKRLYKIKVIAMRMLVVRNLTLAMKIIKVKLISVVHNEFFVMSNYINSG